MDLSSAASPGIIRPGYFELRTGGTHTAVFSSPPSPGRLKNSKKAPQSSNSDQVMFFGLFTNDADELGSLSHT